MKRVGIGGMQMFDAASATPEGQWHAAVRGEAARLDDAGVEGQPSGTPPRRPIASASRWPWRRRAAGARRRALGEAGAGDEEDRVERDARAGPAQVQRRAGRARPRSTGQLPGRCPFRAHRSAGRDAAASSRSPSRPIRRYYADSAVRRLSRARTTSARMADLRPKVTDQRRRRSTRRPSSTATSGRRWRCPVPKAASRRGSSSSSRSPSASTPSRSPWRRLRGHAPWRRPDERRRHELGSRSSTCRGPAASSACPGKNLCLPRDHGPLLSPRVHPPPPSPFDALLRRAPGSTVRRRGDRAALRARACNRWQEKASFATSSSRAAPDPGGRAGAAIARAAVVDLTAKMGKDGRLDWDAPAGTWVVLRMGYSLTGAEEPSRAPGGDRLRGGQAEPQARGDLRRVLRRRRSPRPWARYFGKSLRYLLMDSWEAGMQNWTEDMPGRVPHAARLRPDALSCPCSPGAWSRART